MDGLDRGDDATGSPGARTSRMIGGAEDEVGSSGQHRTCTATIFFTQGLTRPIPPALEVILVGMGLRCLSETVRGR